MNKIVHAAHLNEDRSPRLNEKTTKEIESKTNNCWSTYIDESYPSIIPLSRKDSKEGKTLKITIWNSNKLEDVNALQTNL